ncbi:MAG: redoxin domain-containing protein [bacterium]|nr:redoxin domain-containing protein [bacterium]
MYRRGLSFNGDERSHLFVGGGDGSFLDVSPTCGADSPLDGRAVLAADFDDDGDQDLFVHNLQRERHELFRNETDGRGYVKVLVSEVGAEVTVGASTQVVARGSGFASCQAGELVFGIGDAPRASISVRWPGGGEAEFAPIPAASRVRITRSGATVVPRRADVSLPDPLPPGIKIAVGELVPTLMLRDAAGGTFELDPRTLAAGRRVHLTFWASYCAPCITKLPQLDAIHAAADHHVVAISVDSPEDRERAVDRLLTAGIGYTTAFPPAAGDEVEGFDALIDLSRLPIPTTLVIDPDGRLESVVRGTAGL